MLIYDLADPVELQGFVRNVPLPRFTLSAFLPNVVIDDLEYRFTRGDFADQDMAPYRAFDAEAPIGTRPGLSRVSGELPPLSKKMRLGEEQRHRLRALTGGRGQEQALINQIFDDAANLARAVHARLEMARGQALYEGQVVIAENGVVATADFGYSSDNFVAATDAGGKVWSDPTADIIGQLTRWQEAFVDTNGEPATVLQTSTKVRGYMLRNDAIRTLAASLAGSPQLVTTATLNAVLTNFDLPQVSLYDTKVKVNGVATRVTPENSILLTVAPGGQLGRTFFGVTAEALELVDARQIGADQAPGMVAVNDKTFDPVSIWTKVAAIGIPTIANPELVLVGEVI